MKIIYKVENLENNRKFEFDSEEKLNICKGEGDLGKLARWIWLDQATQFEISREDDRREVEVQAEIPSYIDEDNIVHPAIPAVFKTEIHVPNDFTIEIEDITAQYEAELDLRKTKRKEDLANEVKTYVISKIKDLAISDKLALLGRADINAIMAFLNYGSLEQSKTLLEAASTDTVLTQALKTEIVGVIQEKIDLYNSIQW